MGWHLALLAVHFVLLVMVIMLYRCAPCWMQRLVVVGLGLAFFVMCIAFAIALSSHAWWIYVYALGLALEHVAVSLYVFRVVWQGIASHGHQHAPAAR